jgi:hypothetical protein
LKQNEFRLNAKRARCINMATELVEKVARIAKPYFPDISLRMLEEVAEQLPPAEPTFAQVSQNENQLQLEIGYRSGQILVDLTYKAQTWSETLLRLNTIQQFTFVRGPDQTALICHSSHGGFVRYTASGKEYRGALDRYWASIRGLLGK